MSEEKNIWDDEKPNAVHGELDGSIDYWIREVELDVFLEKLKGKITQIHECLGEYESHEWCSHCIIDAKCAQITMDIIELKKKAETLTFLFGEKGVKTENLMKLQKLEDIRQAFIKSFGEDSIEREDFQAGNYGANDSIDLANTIWKILENAED